MADTHQPDTDKMAEARTEEDELDILINVDFHSKTAKKAAKEIKNAELLPIAEAFAQTFYDMNGLFALPSMYLYMGLKQVQEGFDFIRAATAYPAYLRGDKSVEKEFQDELQRLEEESKKTVNSKMNQILSDSEKKPGIQPVVRMLKFSAVSLAWTLFESVASDLWVTALNVRPQQLGIQVGRGLRKRFRNSDDDVIPIHVLAKRGFDVSGCLGSVLVRQFDFTKLSSARKAYETAFGQVPQLKQIFTKELLRLLQAYRHCIVHRAGIADEDFVSTSKLTIKAGEPLPDDLKRVSALIDASIVAGSQLLTFVDEWLTSHPT